MPERDVLNLSEWKALAARDAAPRDVVLRKQFTSEVKAAADDPRGVELAISTADPDRDRDTLAVEGWRLDNYRRNPVVLFAHDYRALPVARATRVWASDGALRSVAHFVEPEVYPLGETVLQMLKRRYLSAASVGFAPIQWTRNEERGGIDFIEQELLEYSIVPVPANPAALVARAAADGLDLAPLRAWAKSFVGDARDDYATVSRGDPLSDDVLLDLLGVGAGDHRALHAALGCGAPETSDHALLAALGLDGVAPVGGAPVEIDPEAAAAFAVEHLRTALPAVVDARIRRHQGRLD